MDNCNDKCISNIWGEIMIKVKIYSKLEYQTYPIVEGMIKVKESDLKEIGKTKCFDVENQCVIDYTPEPEPEE